MSNNALITTLRKWGQRWHGLLALYHHRAFERHCRHLPSWFLAEVFGEELV